MSSKAFEKYKTPTKGILSAGFTYMWFMELIDLFSSLETPNLMQVYFSNNIVTTLHIVNQVIKIFQQLTVEKT